MFILIGFLFAAIIGLVDIIYTIIAAIAANNGHAYRYPFNLRLIN